jgi:hypothetical protein
MVKFAPSLLFAVLIASPAFASINGDQIDTRELSDYELFSRDLTEAESTLFARDYDELFTRHPDELDAREYEDISRRNKALNGLKKVFGFVKKIFLREDGQEGVFARDYDEVDARDLEDLDAREYEDITRRNKALNGLKKVFGFVKKIFLREDGEEEGVFARDDDEVDARDLDELFTRYLEDLDAREYEDITRRNKALNGLKKVFGFVKKIFFREDGQEGVFAREYDEINIRDLEAIYQRYTEGLEARAPGIFHNILHDGMKHVKAIAHHGEKKKEAQVADAAPEPEVRDFDDLLEREFFDDDLVERDLDLDLDLVERDFDEDLSEREYVEDLYERDFDHDLLERELYDLEERSFDDLD